MATRTRSRSPIRSAGSNQRDVEPEAAAASGRDVSPDTLELIATMESIDSLGEEWTNGVFRCYSIYLTPHSHFQKMMEHSHHDYCGVISKVWLLQQCQKHYPEKYLS